MIVVIDGYAVIPVPQLVGAAFLLVLLSALAGVAVHIAVHKAAGWAAHCEQRPTDAEAYGIWMETEPISGGAS